MPIPTCSGSDSADADTKTDTGATAAGAATVTDAHAEAATDTEATDGKQYQTAKSITLFLDVRGQRDVAILASLLPMLIPVVCKILTVHLCMSPHAHSTGTRWRHAWEISC